MKIEIDGRTLEIVTDMTPLKSINERYSSNIAFVFENGAILQTPKLNFKAPKPRDTILNLKLKFICNSLN